MQLLAPATNDNMQPSMTTATSTPYNTRVNTPTGDPKTSALAKITPLTTKKQSREKSRTWKKTRRVSVRFFLTEITVKSTSILNFVLT